MAFWNFHAPMPMFGWNGGNQVGAARDSGGAAPSAAASGAAPVQQPHASRVSRRGLPPLPPHTSNNMNNPSVVPGASGPTRRRRTRQGRLRSPSPTPELDPAGDALRLSLANEMDDRFSRLKSNQCLASTTKRTGPVHFEEIPSLFDEREAAEKSLVDRYVRILESEDMEGITDLSAPDSMEDEMVHELRLWKERVQQERIDNADLRAYLLARREGLCLVHNSLVSAAGEVKIAANMVFAPHSPPMHPPKRLKRVLH